MTRPWFDYVMGTRVISDSTIAESNPLGIKLPLFVERRLNSMARRLLPKSYERISTASSADAKQRKEGVVLAVAGVA